jgi:hypothetical protein
MEGGDCSHYFTIPVPMGHCRCFCPLSGLPHGLLGLVACVMFCVSTCGNSFDTPWILIYNPSLSYTYLFQNLPFKSRFSCICESKFYFSSMHHKKLFLLFMKKAGRIWRPGYTFQMIALSPVIFLVFKYYLLKTRISCI